MDEKIMMHTGDGLDGEPFDATRWFANGMYRRVPDENRLNGFAKVAITRVVPPPFPDTQVEDLRIRLAGALKRSGEFSYDVPEAAIEKVRDPAFDPRPQIRYYGSSFSEPDEPVDRYVFYMLHESKRYFVNVARDPIMGGIIRTSRDDSPRASPEETDRLFRELEERERQATRQNIPGLRARSGEPCPHPGEWECLDCPPGPQNQRRFEHRQALPQIDGRDVTWRMIRAH